MKYTNKHNLSWIIEKFLLFDEYDYVPGVYSATTLMKPIRQIILTERHYDELEMDISDLIASRYGTAIHSAFEKVDFGETITQEERVFTEVDGKKISGKFDMLEKIEDALFKIIDIKSTSVWNYVYDNKTEDFKTQLSIYRYILSKNEIYTSPQADIILVFTDWKKSDARQKPDYPNTRMLTIENLPLWPLPQTERWLKERLTIIEENKALKDNELPFCTDDEKWKDEDVYAHMREGRKSAVKLYDNEADCKTAIEEDKKNAYLEFRKGMCKRCEDYCACKPICNQYAQEELDPNKQDSTKAILIKKKEVK